MLQLLIAGTLLTGLAAYLLHQFWARSLTDNSDICVTDSPQTSSLDTDAPERLKAA